ncbi:MAG: hypothetical protein IJT41_09690 [Clostridia bacterium]|nr:hypothetical protein [Clostridia bacterium]
MKFPEKRLPVCRKSMRSFVQIDEICAEWVVYAKIILKDDVQAVLKYGKIS